MRGVGGGGWFERREEGRGTKQCMWCTYRSVDSQCRNLMIKEGQTFRIKVP